MKIWIFDHHITKTNPAGSCHLRLIQELADKHDFTVFTMSFDREAISRSRHARVRALSQPGALRLLTFSLSASFVYWFHKRRFGAPDLVQSIVPTVLFGDVAYAHYCHTAYLERERALGPTPGLRARLRRWTHALNSVAERIAYRKMEKVVTPSNGLKRELVQSLGLPDRKIEVIPNPVDTKHYARPSDHGVEETRRSLDLRHEDVVLAFAALGQFERKGLPETLEALSLLGRTDIKLLVVGGRRKLVERFEAAAEARGLRGATRFVGFQTDIRAFLWSSDAFVFPSRYESFGLAVFQAAAAGLPLLVTPLNGVEEILVNGKNGFLITSPTPRAIADALERFVALTLDQRREMGAAAVRSVAPYGLEMFSRRWMEFYARWE